MNNKVHIPQALRVPVARAALIGDAAKVFDGMTVDQRIEAVMQHDVSEDRSLRSFLKMLSDMARGQTP